MSTAAQLRRAPDLTATGVRGKRRPGKREAEYIRLARLIQNNLQPPALIELPGLQAACRYLPSRLVSGDFYDCFPLGGQSWCLYLGDVQGKGLEAALYGLLVNGTMRGLRKTGWRPADVVELLNQRLCFRATPGRFSCLSYALFEFEENRRRLTFSNAGLPFPLLLRRGRVSSIELTGTPVGLFETGSFDQVSVNLEPGDRLLFYTDGVPESLACRRTELSDGENKLQQLLAESGTEPVTELANTLAARLQQIQSRSRRLHDDSTFVVVHID